MLARAGELPRDDRAYGYEVKWDGVRAIAHLAPGHLTLTGRNRSDFTPRYPEIGALAGEARGEHLLLDGEVVAFDERGRPSFERLQSRMNLASEGGVRHRMAEIPVTYVIFDVLWLAGRSTLSLPYADRRRLLSDLDLNGSSWRTPAHREGDGAALLRASDEQGLEGIVAKRLDSPYEPGRRSTAWIKIKNHCVQEFVVGGFTPGSGGRANSLGALAVGVFDRAGGRGPGDLLYAGKVGTGFTDVSIAALLRELEGLRVADSPFGGRKPPKEVVFVEPRLVARVEFLEWTVAGTLRAPSFKGLVPEADPRTVVRET
jgi:bifunctional non-homologous end joining protein LigD